MKPHASLTSEWRKKRRATGGCVDCLAPAVPGKGQCVEHLEDNCRRSQKARRRRVRKGLCSKCPAPSIKARSLCQFHLEQNRRTTDACRQRKGVIPKPSCLECGANAPMTGQALCWCCTNAPVAKSPVVVAPAKRHRASK